MSDEMTDQEIISRQQAQEDVEIDRWRNDLAWLMSNEQGQRIINRVFDETRVFGGNLFDKHAGVMAERIGRQGVGKWLQGELMMANPSLFLNKILMSWAAKQEADRKSNSQIKS